MPIPKNPKIYHIVHIDRLESIIRCNALWCDARVVREEIEGTTIGMSKIKERRLRELTLECHPDLYVGDCVPFYFCPRSVMLYLIHRGNHDDLSYRDGQEPIVHLQADLRTVVDWAEEKGKRWAFTLSNAGSRYFEARNDLNRLGDIVWDAVNATQWQECKDAKQAEFLVEDRFPWRLIERIGVLSRPMYQRVSNLLPEDGGHRPPVEIKANWYY